MGKQDGADLEVKNNAGKNRFEVNLDGGTAVAEYRREGNRIVFTHTEVPESMEGKGVAKALVTTALDFARRERLEVTPQCSFVAGYIKRHPEYLDIVATDYRQRLA